MKNHGQEQNNQNRDVFSSQMGLILAAAGSAVGLGNIWRFSYIVGVNGGGAFLLIYLLCVVLIGVPLLMTELLIGRRTKLSPVPAFEKLAPKSAWILPGIIGTLAAFLIMTYYPVVAGWSLNYVVSSITDWQSLSGDSGAFFGSMLENNMGMGIFALVALAATAICLFGGVSKGIEKWNKVLMPLLFIIVIVLVFRSLTLPGAIEGVKFLFIPDFSKLSVGGVLDALGHSFFSLSLGMAIMITYGSYVSKDEDLLQTTTNVVLFDTGVALLAGLAIFPAVFAFGLEPGQGAGLAFVTLPNAFAMMPGGRWFSALFFLLIAFAALTSMISLMQTTVALLEDRFHWARIKAVVCVTVVLFALNIPSLLSFNVMGGLTIFGDIWFDFMDSFANNILLPVTGLLTILFVIGRFKVANAIVELEEGAKNKNHFLLKAYPILMKFIAPAGMIFVLVYSVLKFAGIV